MRDLSQMRLNSASIEQLFDRGVVFVQFHGEDQPHARQARGPAVDDVTLGRGAKSTMVAISPLKSESFDGNSSLLFASSKASMRCWVWSQRVLAAKSQQNRFVAVEPVQHGALLRVGNKAHRWRQSARIRPLRLSPARGRSSRRTCTISCCGSGHFLRASTCAPNASCGRIDSQPGQPWAKTASSVG